GTGRNSGGVGTGVADDGDGAHAAQIVGALVPVGQVPQEGAARRQFGALRPGRDGGDGGIVAGDEGAEVRRGNQDQLVHQGGGGRSESLVGLKSGKIGAGDQAAHAETYQIDLRHLRPGVVLDGIQESAQVVAQGLDG